MKELKTPVRITISDDRKIDTVAMGSVGLKLMDGTPVTLSDVLYIPEVEGSLISVAKLAEKDVFAQFSKDKCVFRYGDATVMEDKRCGNVYKLKTVGDEVCHVATTSCKEPWAVVHARLGHIPYKRYEQLLTMADGVPRVADAPSDHVCAGCCIGKMHEDNFSRSAENTVKSAGFLDLVHSDVMGPLQTKTPGDCTYAVTFIDDFSRHVTVYFMKKKAEVLEKFKIV
ncbi:hypothetical protein PF008_g16510 [Phytophthora fragariae]|uniref:Retrovirus-related Pol polyprotein from transposon TNT 1-94-like beta-barrel domain-containing protein n=1 Tax=Phytophthora fragariae TaxID=53985 RepID=A0A6G0RBF5_9STRA|nr:hypothetical protein PF008_g16510 [Phytophthora fragariae]